MRIQRLPTHLVNQIAAGEVIERPSSVVKELVENSLDAGAKRIQVDLEEGGRRLIRVTDDGTGIVFEDLELSFASHATSKIVEEKDLWGIASLGFRGEALASIGAVSRAKILSRAAGASIGGTIENEGGQISTPKEAGAALGTSIEIRDLFFNLPARRKFLRTASTELGHIVDLLIRISLPFEGVEFVLRHEGKLVLRLPADFDLRERLREAFGEQISESLVELKATGPLGTITGFVGLPRIARNDVSRQFLYVNGRFIRDRALLRALREGYREFLPHERQPVAFLFLGVDPNSVDQNVHPSKIEVRFRESRELFSFVQNTVREALQKSNLASSVQEPVPSSMTFGKPIQSSTWSFTPKSYSESPRNEFSAPSKQEFLFTETQVSQPVLQVHNTYLIRETPEGFEVLDQHALHERVLFEQFKQDYGAGKIAVQGLLVPELVEVSRADVFLIEEKKEELRKLGFDLEAFGEKTLAVRALPARLRRLVPKEMVEEILSVLKQENNTAKHGFVEELLHRAACRAAVMAGDTLSQEEIASLFQSAANLDSDQTCPHSRPTRVRFSLYDLEKAFHRR